MTVDLKYEPGQQVVVDLEGSYRFARIIGYEIMCANFTEHSIRYKYELSVSETMLDKQGKEVEFEPRIVWRGQDEIESLLAKLKTQKEKSPDSKPSTLLWNMRAEDNKRDELNNK